MPLITNANRTEYFSKIHDSDIYPEVGDHYGYYNLLADAFEAGRLSLPIEPKPELLALPNPYDSTANAGYRLHDASLKDGKYYLYFGAVPALLFFLPFRLLGLGMLSEPLAVALLYCGILWLSYEMVCRLCKEGGIHSGWWQPFSALTLGFGGATLYILRRPVVYEVAIVSGSFFALIALRFLFQYYFSTFRTNWKWLALSGLSVALAVGSRPTCIIMAPLIGFGMFGLWFFKTPNIKGAIRDMLAFGLPVFMGLMLIFAYNYARFGSWREFGMSYQLMGPGNPWDLMFTFKVIPSALFHYFLNPPKISAFFPYFTIYDNFPLPWKTKWDLPDGIFGIFYLSPIILVSLFFPIIFYRMKINDIFFIFTITFLNLSGILICIFLGFISGACTSRYLSDFLIFLLISSCITISIIINRINTSFKALLLILLLFSITLNIFIGYVGLYDLFKKSHFETYARIESWTSACINPFLEKPNQSQILDIYSIEGNGHTQDGVPVMLVGKKGGFIRIYSKNACKIHLSINCNLLSNTESSYSYKMLTASIIDSFQKDFWPVSNGSHTFSLRLESGVNWIHFYLHDLKELPGSLKKPSIAIVITNISFLEY